MKDWNNKYWRTDRYKDVLLVFSFFRVSSGGIVLFSKRQKVKLGSVAVSGRNKTPCIKNMKTELSRGFTTSAFHICFYQL